MRRKILNAAAFGLAAFVCFTNWAFAQVEVVESSPTVRRQNDSNPNPFSPVTPAQPIGEQQNSNSSSNAQADMYYQFQLMQQEIASLRGRVEELNNEVKKLKQQRLDDYVELDKRISQMSSSGANPRSDAVSPTGVGPASGNATSNTGSRPSLVSADERTSYQNALKLLLDNKDYDGAIAAFKEHLVQFPGGQYEGNVYFWLAQVFVIQEKHQQAAENYATLIERYPNHDKVWEAKFALGKTYFTMGDRSRARTLLQEVADSNSDVARLARNYIQERYP